MLGRYVKKKRPNARRAFGQKCRLGGWFQLLVVDGPAGSGSNGRQTVSNLLTGCRFHARPVSILPCWLLFLAKRPVFSASRPLHAGRRLDFTVKRPAFPLNPSSRLRWTVMRKVFIHLGASHLFSYDLLAEPAPKVSSFSGNPHTLHQDDADPDPVNGRRVASPCCWTSCRWSTFAAVRTRIHRSPATECRST
ncbi:hypothetical protein ALCH109712_10480 [Alkalicoccus chagannorensis]